MQPRRSIPVIPLLVVIMVLASAGCSTSKTATGTPSTRTSATAAAATRNLAALAAYDGQLSTFATMLNVSGVLTAVGARGPYTVFAPTNDAFARLSHARLNALLSPAGRTDLRQLIRNAVVRGRLLAKDLKPGSLKTLSGATVKLGRRGDVVTLTDARGRTANVSSGPLLASNGVLYRVDAVFAHA